MSKTWRKLLSVLLALSMIVSLTVTGYATGSEKTAKVDSGKKLKLEEIDPNTLSVPRIGQITKDAAPEEEEDLYAPDDIVRVTIVLDKAATLDKYPAKNVAKNVGAVSYRAGLKYQQQEATRQIEQRIGRPIEVKWNLTLAMNAISANVRYGDIAAIRTVPGVKCVMLENQYEPQVDEINTAVTTEYMVGAAGMWANGYTGAGSRVAIIDTGTDHEHISFDPEALEYALAEDGGDYNLLTWDEISSLAGQLNVSVTEEVYKNTKIPYAYNYVDRNYVTDSMHDSQGEHGSHVAGIAAANRYILVDGEYVEAASAVGAVGVAPDAQIITMKVFGAGGGAYDSDYMIAIEDAIVLGCDSVNLSLGSGATGFAMSNGYQSVMDNLVKCGTVVAMSAGNSGSWVDSAMTRYPYLYLDDVSFATGGSPGSFNNSLTIASVDNIGQFIAPLYFNDGQMVSYSETSGYNNEPIKTIAGTYEYVLVDGPGVVPLTDADDDTGETAIGDPTHDAFAALGSDVLSGKVAMCYRGSSSFYVKANAAAAQGAVAVIIINNQPGVINMNLTGYSYTAPAVSILKADGDQVKADSEAVTDDNGTVLYYTGSVEITAEAESIVSGVREEASMSSFSSWGVPGSLTLKPELATPGGSIWSVWGANTGSSSPTTSHEDYELMSGTSMAAPHATGMAALLGQYIRENDLENVTGVDARTLINSLLMSTATPMFDADGYYVPVLQQGAGLGEAFLATQAKSYITMNEDATTAWDDGKVKVELGQDAAREGVYEFSFNINNFSDVEMEYELATDIFTQNFYPDFLLGTDYGMLDFSTMSLGLDEDYTVEYDYPEAIPNAHDVNMDGKTDKDDAQAILDKMTGKYAEDADFDEEAADMDGNGKYTSYDAHLLLVWLDETEPGLVVPAGESVTVGVTITLTDDVKEFFDYYLENGAYIEGFTYVTPITETVDGELLGVEHSIPILGFYGSWTDASMFDAVSAVDEVYGTDKVSYFGAGTTNYLTVNRGKGNEIMLGNPYTVEDVFPVDRLALSGNTTLVSFKTNLIRNASSAGVLALDGDFNVLKNGVAPGYNYGAYFYVNGNVWQQTAAKTTNMGYTVDSLGVEEGDTFLLGYFAVPEYYGMTQHPGEGINYVTGNEIAQLLSEGEIGAGAYVGYTFTVDNTAPVIEEVSVDDEKTVMTVTLHDDNYIAYVTLMDVYGNEELVEGVVPEQAEPGETVTVEFPISEAMGNGVAVVAGDYAANETAKFGKINDEPIVSEKEVYVLTDTVEEGEEYVIANIGEAGTGYATLSTSYSGANSVVPVRVKDNGEIVYLEMEDPNAKWIAGTKYGESTFQNVGTEGYLGVQLWGSEGELLYSWSSAYDTFVYNNYELVYYDTYYAHYDETQKAFALTATETNCYLFVKSELVEEFDPEQASDIIVTPEENVLVMGTTETVQLTAEVKPIVLEDKSVTWASSDEDVAVVDENGLVTAIAPGDVEITATTNAEPHLSGSAKVKVIEVEAPVVELRGGLFDTNGKSLWTEFTSDAPADWTETGIGCGAYSGTLVGDKLYVFDNDAVMFRVDADTYDATQIFELNPAYMPSDMAEWPEELTASWGYDGFNLAAVLSNGTLFGIFNPDPDEFNLLTVDFSEEFGSDPMAAIAYAGPMGSYAAVYFVITESGEIYAILVDEEGSFYSSDMGATGLTLSGVASLENTASMIYDQETEWLYLAYYDGNGETNDLYAIDPYDPMYTAKQGDFGDNVWPVACLYQYDPVTDLVLEVDPTEVTIREGSTAKVNIFIKLGETNEFTATSSDETVATMDENGVITGIKAGECTITVTTVDTNAAGEHLSADIKVTVEENNSIYGFYFEDEEEVGQWTFVDSDGDGNNWIWTLSSSDFSQLEAYEGAGMILSQSYINNVGAMTPDNWAISPAMDFTDVPAEATLSVYAKGQDPSWAGEHFILYAGTSADPDEMVAVSDEFIATGEWTRYTADLSDFAGEEEVYVAIRHCHITDMFYLDVDQVEVVMPSLSLTVEPKEVSVAVGASVALDIKVEFGETGEFTVESADEDIATVDEDGVITGVAAGNTTVTVTTVDVDDEGNPKTATVNVSVVQTASSFDFETDPVAGGWTFVDKDGDGFNWTWEDCSETPHMTTYEGDGCIYSCSYDNDTYTALTPDNWAVSPAIDMSEMSAPGVTFYAAGQDASYAAEVFAIYAGTTADPDSMTKVGGDFTATGTYTMYSADLSDFAGAETVYVAIRHYNVTDMFALVVDNFEIVDGAKVAPTPVEPTARRNIFDSFINLKTGTEIRYTDEAIDAVKETNQNRKVAFGGLNVFTGDRTATRANELPIFDRSALTLEDNEDAKVITITEEVDVTNGAYEVTYDPEKLTFVSAEADHEISSVNVDEENGVISIAFADLEAVAAGETLVTLNFTVACEDTEITVTTTERNDEDELEETETLTIEGIGHDWGEPTWEWADDFSSATATFVCGNNEEHVEIVDAEITNEVTDPTCTEDGEIVYTATVTGPDGNEYTDTQTETIDATGHTEGEPVIENEVEPTCTEAGSYDEVVYCEVCGEELSRETVTVDPLGHEWGEWELTTEPTCDEEGEETRTCERCGEIETRVVDVLGHTEGEPVIENEVEPTCTEAGSYDKVVYCEVCGEELSRETITVDPLGHTEGKAVKENEVEPTCDEPGSYDMVVFCSVCGEELSRETVTVDPLGHDWGEPTFTWSEDYKTVTATFVCARDESHVMEVAATVTTETTDPTCTEDGEVVYTATVTVDGEEYTDSKSVTLPAMGHDWGEPVWTWSDDHKSATATFTCTICGETYTVTDSAILTDTTEDGKITYTASVVGPDGTTYTTTYVGSVDTGDAMNLSLYFGLMLISAAAAIVVLRAMKKKEN